MAQPCYISQSLGDGTAPISFTEAVGQSFIACGDGVVTQVVLNLTDLETTELTFNMSAGENTLTREYTQQLDVQEDGEVVVLLDTPFPVTDGETYAFSLVGVSGEDVSAVLRGASGNPYAGGVLFNIIGGVATVFSAADLQFSVSVLPAACTLVQREDNAFGNINNVRALGQSFTPCTTGAITELEFKFTERTASSFRLQLSAGGNTLTPGYTQDFTSSTVGTQHVTLNTPFPVMAGETFSFSVLSLDAGADGIAARLAGFNGNPYPDGATFLTEGGVATVFGSDQFFAITIAEMTCLIDQPETNAFFNSSSAISVGQSFTACKNGRVSHIRFNTEQGNLQEVRIDLNKGDNTLGADYSQTVKIEGAGDHLVPLFSSFNVLDGETYSFSITAVGEQTDNIFGFNGDPYPGGSTFTINNGAVTTFGSDLNFSILTFEDDGVVSVTQAEDLSIRLNDAYPNPASGTFTVPYSLDQSREVTIQLYDLNGRQLKRVVKGRQPAGTYQEEVNVADLSAGLYFYGIQTESGLSMTKRIVIQ